MATILASSFSAFKPIKLNYNFYKNEVLQTQTFTYTNNLTLNNLDGLKNFRDIALNKGTCFILTSAVSLSSIFTNTNEVNFGTVPGTIQFQSRQTVSKFAAFDPLTNTIKLNNTPSSFFVLPVTNTNEIEIKVNNKFLQVDENYPYIVRVNSVPLPANQIHRQRFLYTYKNNILTLKTKTKDGFRFLSFTQDTTLRATGLILNRAALHNYGLKVFNITQNNFQYNFISNNNWVTYFQDFESQSNNNSLKINKEIQNTPTNFLITFSIKDAINTQNCNINIANLKTSYTPAGGPAPLDNSYDETIITTN
jgi:hypothetical protein